MIEGERQGGIEIERDGNGRSDIQPERQGAGGGRQVSETVSEADREPAGGSSGTGGYGNAQNQQFHQGQAQGQAAYGNSGEPGASRGEKFDEAQGGGRGSA